MAAETLTFRFSNPRVENYAPDNYLVFDVQVKASANGTYLYASQVICNIDLANFNTSVQPFVYKGFIDGQFDPPGPPLLADKYSVTANYNSGNLNIAVLANVNFNTTIIGAHSEITTSWQTLCSVYCLISNPSGVAGISFQTAAMNGYQKYATGIAPLYSAYYNSPNLYQGDNFTDLYLARIYSGLSGWTQYGGGVDWTASVNTSVWDISTSAATVGNETQPDALANNLKIYPAGAVIISPGSSLTVANTLTNNSGVAGLIIQSSATATGSLIHSTAGVQAMAERYLAMYDVLGDHMFHFLSSPMEAQDIRPGFVTNVPTFGHDFYAFDELNNMWFNSKAENGNWNPAFEDSFIQGKGYLVAYPEDVTKTFTGILNTYTVASPLVLNCTYTSGKGNGWNLLGNPFPSSIDWDMITRGNGMDDALYYYNNEEENYQYYLPLPGIEDGYLGNGSQFIPPMQGFMVHATATGTKTVSISNDARTHEGKDTFYKSVSSVPGSLSLKVTANGFEDEAFIHFNHHATTAFDGQYDAYKIRSYSESVPTIYTNSSDGYELAINGLPEVAESTVIPVYFVPCSNGNYSLTANLQSMIQARVYLEDTQLNKIQNLTENPVYNFQASTTDQPGRFRLSFSSVGIEDNTAISAIEITANSGNIYIASPQGSTIQAEVYNITGQLVLQQKFIGESLSVMNASSLTKGVYIVKVIMGERLVSRKVVNGN